MAINKRIYCADATKLIAADSWVSFEPLRDPEAENAFSDLTTILCNSAEIYFFKRQNLEADRLGEVANAWTKAASPNSSSTNSVNEIWMDSELAESFATIFKGSIAKRAVEWVCFQSSIPRLMRVFW